MTSPFAALANEEQSRGYADRTQAGGSGGRLWKRGTQIGAPPQENLETAPLRNVLSLRRSRVRAPSAPPHTATPPRLLGSSRRLGLGGAPVADGFVDAGDPGVVAAR